MAQDDFRGALDVFKRVALKAAVRAGAALADSLAGDAQRVAGSFAGKVGAGREMLREIMKGNMKGLSFAEVRLRESFEYLNNMAAIASADRERGIARMVEELEIQEEARTRYLARKSA